MNCTPKNFYYPDCKFKIDNEFSLAEINVSVKSLRHSKKFRDIFDELIDKKINFVVTIRDDKFKITDIKWELA